MRYHLRYTNDDYVINQSDDWSTLVCASDYKVHIIDTSNGSIVWQNSVSTKYGKEGFLS